MYGAPKRTKILMPLFIVLSLYFTYFFYISRTFSIFHVLFLYFTYFFYISRTFSIFHVLFLYFAYFRSFIVLSFPSV